MQNFSRSHKNTSVTKTKFHKFSLPEKRTLEIVIKIFLRSITAQEVAEELSSQGYEVTHVQQFGSSDKKLPLHIITLKNIPKNSGIFGSTTLFYIKISIERYRSNTPAQCFNYQRFGHSSYHCGFSSRCFMCARIHKPSKCRKIKEKEPKCLNCNSSHTTHFQKCPAILK